MKKARFYILTLALSVTVSCSAIALKTNSANESGRLPASTECAAGYTLTVAGCEAQGACAKGYALSSSQDACLPGLGLGSQHRVTCTLKSQQGQPAVFAHGSQAVDIPQYATVEGSVAIAYNGIQCKGTGLFSNGYSSMISGVVITLKDGEVVETQFNRAKINTMYLCECNAQ